MLSEKFRVSLREERLTLPSYESNSILDTSRKLYLKRGILNDNNNPVVGVYNLKLNRVR